MIKTLHQTLRQEKEKFKIPRSVQQVIPIQCVWPDGIFRTGKLYSKSYRFTDINYYIADKENKKDLFLKYSELLNALDSGATAKITINNRRIDKEEFEHSILLPMKGDDLDHYREEYNDMLRSKISETNNSIIWERYLTISVFKKNVDEARTFFSRVGTEIMTHLSKLSSTGEELDAGERLKIFRDFFREEEPPCVPFDLKAFAKKGHSFQDWIAPDSMEFAPDHFKINDRYGRVLYMQDYANYVKDSMVSELCDLSRNLMLSIENTEELDCRTPCMIMSTIDLLSTASACHLTSDRIIFLECHVVIWISNASCIEEILVVENHPEITSEWKLIICSIIKSHLLNDAAISGCINAISFYHRGKILQEPSLDEIVVARDILDCDNIEFASAT